MRFILTLVFVSLIGIQCNNNEHSHSHNSAQVSFEKTAQTVKSEHSVSKTADNLQRALIEKGMNIFLTVKHHEGAKAAGLELRPTITVVFGNPKVGTKLMQCSQTSGLDQPMKALIWEDKNGDVWLAYNTIEYLTQRHGNAECASDVTGNIKKALAHFAKVATG